MLRNHKTLTIVEIVFSVAVILACFLSVYLFVLERTSQPFVIQRSSRINVIEEQNEQFKISIARRDEINLLSERYSTVTTERVLPENGVIRDLFRRKMFATNPTPHPKFRGFVINNKDICNTQSTDILICFHSTANNFNQRRTLRETWANKHNFNDITVRTVFLLGRPAKDGDQIRIRNENSYYRDIIQGDFIDSMSNITHKAIMMLKWMNDFCPNAQYIIKGDDDVFFNIFEVVDKLIPSIHNSPYTAMCALKSNNTAPIVRNKNSKWFLPPEILSKSTYYPQFCPGFAVILTSDLVPLFLEASRKAPVITIDDIYTFVILGQAIKEKINYVNIEKNSTLNVKRALDEYSQQGAVTRIIASAWQANSLTQLWMYSLNKIPKRLRSSVNFARLRKRKSDQYAIVSNIVR